MKRPLAFLLALAMCLSMTACGGSDPSGESLSPEVSDAPAQSQLPVPSQAPSPSAGPSSSPSEAPSAGPSEDPAQPSAPEEPSPAPEGPAPCVTLSHSDVTLFRPGGSFTLSAAADSATLSSVVFHSENEEVAAVDENGLVTAVAPGVTTVRVYITAQDSRGTHDLVLSCIVRCRWDVEPSASPSEPQSPAPSEEPSEAPAPSVSVPPIVIPGAGPSPEPSQGEEVPPTGPSASDVDLDAFYQTIASDYEFPGMVQLGSDYLANDYPGLSSIPCVQRLVYEAAMTFTVCEVALVQVSDSADVEAVRDIFQARIDSQAAGGAYYLGSMENWQNNSRIAVNGNYIMLVAGANCDDIVDAFNALF